MANNLALDGTLTVGGQTTVTGNISMGSSTATSTLSTLNNGVVTTSTTKVLLVTTEAITTATQTIYTCTITNTQVTIGDTVFATMTKGGTNTSGGPVILDATATAGAVTVRVYNAAATISGGLPLSGTLVFQMLILKA